MTNQQYLWNDIHAAGEHAKYGVLEPRKFAVKTLATLKPQDKLLELGCGIGNDARFFASHAIAVTATDFSDIVIAQNNHRNHHNNLTYDVLNISGPFPYADAAFDAVYAHLSLHYFDDKTMQVIIYEIARVLKPTGQLCFSCKSIKDPKYGQGTLIGPDMFENIGHIRHFFSSDYAKQLVKANFKNVNVAETNSSYVGEDSAFIECFATKM